MSQGCKEGAVADLSHLSGFTPDFHAKEFLLQAVNRGLIFVNVLVFFMGSLSF